MYVQLQPSPINGVGVFAVRDIPRGTKIFANEQSAMVEVDRASLKDESESMKKLYHNYCVWRGEKLYCPVNFNSVTPAYFINHADTPNVMCDEDFDFVALRDILPGEELLVDYRTYNS